MCTLSCTICLRTRKKIFKNTSSSILIIFFHQGYFSCWLIWISSLLAHFLKGWRPLFYRLYLSRAHTRLTGSSGDMNLTHWPVGITVDSRAEHCTWGPSDVSMWGFPRGHSVSLWGRRCWVSTSRLYSRLYKWKGGKSGAPSSHTAFSEPQLPLPSATPSASKCKAFPGGWSKFDPFPSLSYPSVDFDFKFFLSAKPATGHSYAVLLPKMDRNHSCVPISSSVLFALVGLYIWLWLHH